MLKKIIKYTDYDGEQRTETFYFNLSKIEVMELEAETDGGILKSIQNLVESQDNAKIIEIFKKIILMSYGEKSPDGKRFAKSKELSTAFSQTEAFTELFMELAMDANAATEFMNGIVPKVEASK